MDLENLDQIEENLKQEMKAKLKENKSDYKNCKELFAKINFEQGPSKFPAVINSKVRMLRYLER